MQEQMIPDEDLNAFIDGELDPARAADIAAALAARPVLAARVAALRADKAQIARIYGRLAEEPLPAALGEAMARTTTRQQPQVRQRGWLRPAAWAIAAAAVLAALGWFGAPLLRSAPADRLVAEAIAARDGAERPAETLTGSTLPPPAARDQLLSAALKVPVKTPNLEKAGFALDAVGIYGDPQARRALELSYRDGRGRRFTVYLHGPTGADGFELRQSGATRICIWQNADLSAVMVGEMSSEEILRVASLTYADLNF